MTLNSGAVAIESVAVVVPAHDEQRRLPRCLDSLMIAAEQTPLPVLIYVVADRCTDDTAAVARSYPGVVTILRDAGRVGAARRAGAAAALCTCADPSRTWIGNTDADCVVPPSWITQHTRLADGGADLVLGTVDLPSRTLQDARFDAWVRAYRQRITAIGRHGHVHGANLGIRASTYLAVGGWRELAAHEDAALADAVRRLAPSRVHSYADGPVVTSARLRGRAPHGVAADLRRRATGLFPTATSEAQGGVFG